MRTIVKGKNFEVADADRRYAQDKLHRLERVLDDRSEAVVEFNLERNKSVADSHIIEVTLVIDGQPLRGVARAATYRAAIDEVVDKLERRAVDHKEKPRARVRPGAARGRPAAGERGLEATASAPSRRPTATPPSSRSSASRSSRCSRRTPSPAWRSSGHSFFIFVNAENERMAVLYRRDDGQFGLIEPAIGGSYAARG